MSSHPATAKSDGPNNLCDYSWHHNILQLVGKPELFNLEGEVTSPLTLTVQQAALNWEGAERDRSLKNICSWADSTKLCVTYFQLFLYLLGI